MSDGGGMTDLSLRTARTGCGRPTVPVVLTADQRAHVEGLLRSGKVEKRVYLRGRALLMMADSVPANRIAWELGVHERTTEKWRERFRVDDPVKVLTDAPRSGRPTSLSRLQTAHA
jgi:winged helix-turn helix protein